MDRERQANDKFNCTEAERACFEAGIKLATVYHQFVGTPVDCNSVSGLETAISKAIEVQPYVESAKVSIKRDLFVKSDDEYSYLSLTGDMIDAVVVIALGNTRVTAEMRYDKELGYPLMYVSDVSSM